MVTVFPGKRAIRPMLTADLGSAFAGIALQRLPRGLIGRTPREGIMQKTQLAHLSAAIIGVDTVLYQSDNTAGQFATSGTRAALAGVAADWAYFKAAA